MIGNRIKELRLALHLKQKDFAAAIGMPASSLCQVEKGQHIPGIAIIQAIAQKFSISYEWLLGTGGAESPALASPIDDAATRAILNNIRELLQSEGLSTAAFAKLCGFDSHWAANMLKGKSPLPLPALLRILRTFPGYNANWLLLGRGSMHITEADTEIQEIIRSNKALIKQLQQGLPRT